MERRKARTRESLIDAASELLARPTQSEVSVQQITDLADVGVGSFYNYFDNKEQLYDAAILASLENYGILFDSVTQGIADPAERFAAGVRMTVRLRSTHSQMTLILMNRGLRYMNTSVGLAPRALRDLEAAESAGRLNFPSLRYALACTTGSILGVLQLHEDDRTEELTALSDQLAFSLLRMFGMDKRQAERLSRKELRPPVAH